jgi:hypothetical protein
MIPQTNQLLDFQVGVVGPLRSFHKLWIHAVVPHPDHLVQRNAFVAWTCAGRDLASSTSRLDWTAARDAREPIQKFKDLIQKAGQESAK